MPRPASSNAAMRAAYAKAVSECDYNTALMVWAPRRIAPSYAAIVWC